MAPVHAWSSLLTTGLCGKNPYPRMKWSKTLLLQTAAECTVSKLSSKFVRSRYQVYSPYNDTEDEGLLNKFVDEEPGKESKAGATYKGGGGYLLPTCLLVLTQLLTVLATGKSFVKKLAEVLDDARDKVGSTTILLPLTTRTVYHMPLASNHTHDHLLL